MYSRGILLSGLSLAGVTGVSPTFADDLQPSVTGPEVTTTVNTMKAVFEPNTPRVSTVTVTFQVQYDEEIPDGLLDPLQL